MFKYTFYIGLNDRLTNKQIISTEEAKKIVAKICKDCTITEATGAWNDVYETTLIVNVITFNVCLNTDFYCQQLGEALNQAVILWDMQKLQSNEYIVKHIEAA